MSYSLYDWLYSDDPNILGCADLGCADVGVGIYHHPSCGRVWDEDEFYGPLTPEEEEMMIEDVNC